MLHRIVVECNDHAMVKNLCHFALKTSKEVAVADLVDPDTITAS